MDVTKTDISRRRNGAIIAAAVMIVFFAGLIALFIWANLTAPIPPLIFGLIIAVPAAVILGIVIALLQRIKELKGGEYDDARKY